MSDVMKNPDQEFRDHLANGRFCLQQCESTGQFVWYPRVAAPGTGARDLRWVEMSGRGRVYSTTTVRERPPAPSYNVALVDLDEGIRMMSRVEGMPTESVRIGLRVQAKITVQDGQPLLVFEPDLRSNGG
jgi:uncharacterized protein